MSDWRSKEFSDFEAILEVFKQNTQNWRLADHVFQVQPQQPKSGLKVWQAR